MRVDVGLVVSLTLILSGLSIDDKKLITLYS